MNRMNSIRVIIPSKGRSKTIAQYSLALFPHAVVSVDEREVDDYAPVIAQVAHKGATLLPHPPLRYLPQIRNWLLDNVADESFVMVDDDVRRVYSKVGKVIKHYRKPNDVMQIIENAHECARGIGARLFGFTQDGGVFGFKPTDPLRFNGWVGTVFGVIGRGIRYDERLAIGSEDIDFSLRHLMEHRVVFMDTRFHFESVNRLRSTGGNAFNRSLEREKREGERLQQVWGDYVYVGFKDSGVRVKSLRVKRRQAKV